MAEAYLGLGNLGLEPGGHPLDGFHLIMQIVDLAAPAQLPADSVVDDGLVVFQNISLYWMPVLGRLLQRGHITDAGQGHIQGAGNRGGGKSEHIHVFGDGFKPLLLGHTEPLFLVDDHQPQIPELDVLLNQPVGADDHVDFSPLQLFEDLRLLLGRAEPGKDLHLDGETFEPLGNSLVMLPGQYRGGHQQGALLGIRDAFEGRPQSHLGFAEAYVAAQQPVHRLLLLHILLDLLDAPELVLRFLVLEPGLKIPLPAGIRRKRVALQLHPLGVKLDQLLGDVLHRAANPGLGLLPVLAPQAVQAHLDLLLGADIFGNHVKLGDGHI